MLKWILLFLAITLIAGVIGFGGFAGDATGAAQWIFGIGLILCVVTAIIRIVSAQ